MLSPIEETLLKEFLANLPYPEQALSYHELMGFMYGLTITPEPIPRDEWLGAIFNEDQATVPAEALARGMDQILIHVFDSFRARKLRGDLHFPYQVENLLDSDLDEILEWSFGFEEALSLRPEIWEPEEDPEAAGPEDEELFFCMMVLHGLNDPLNILPVFEQLPREITESFKVFEPDHEDSDLQLQAYLLTALPLAVQSLQEYGTKLEQENGGKPRRVSLRTTPQPISRTKKTKAGKVIQVDFTKKNKI